MSGISSSTFDFDKYSRDYYGECNTLGKSTSEILDDYQARNPLLDSKGNPIDFTDGKNGNADGMGKGINDRARGDILAAVATAQATVEDAIIGRAQANEEAVIAADTAMRTTAMDCDVRYKESNDNLDAVKYEADKMYEAKLLEFEIEEGKLELEKEALEVDRYRIDRVDNLQAQAAQTSADAEYRKADGKATEAEADAQATLAGDSNYWWG